MGNAGGRTMAINVRYNLMRTQYELALKNLCSTSMLYVSDSDQGKTDTVRIFSKDNTGVWLVTPSSEQRLIEEFEERSNTIAIVIDEPDDWTDKKDYKNAAMMCKHLTTGEIRAPRSNYFTTSISEEKKTETAIILMCNKKQYDYIRLAITRTGLLKRSIIIRTHQNSLETNDYVRGVYKKYGGRDNISFADEYSFIARNPITKKEQFFADVNFKGMARETVLEMARITPEDKFAELMPYLESDKKGRYIEETVKFIKRRKEDVMV